MIRTILAWGLALAVVAGVLLRWAVPHTDLEAIVLVAFTPWVAGAAVVAAVATLALRRRVPAGLASLGAIALLVTVAPRAFGDAEPVRERTPLTIMSANVRLGLADPQAVASAARAANADVVVLEELTPGFGRAVAAAGFDGRYPHRVLRTGPRAYGLGIYSRVPLGKIPGSGGALAARLRLADGQGLEVHAVHPPAPNHRRSVGPWAEGLRGLARATPDGPLRVLAGDFNATLDHAPLRHLIGSGYRDAADVVGEGLDPTWPSTGQIPPGVTIDHVLADRRIGVSGYDVRGIRGSDHRAVLARLAVPRAARR